MKTLNEITKNMTREIKFRFWDGETMLDMTYVDSCMGLLDVFSGKTTIISLQFTGLKDKNGLQEVYEGDIIDEYGNIKGNTYEMDAGETDFIIQGFGDKNWGATYKEAVGRGCTDTQRYADTDEIRKLD